MSGHGTDGNRGSFARADAQVKFRDMAGSPASLGVVGRDGVGCFDERPFEILIGLGSQFSIASLAATGTDPRRGAAVAAELRGRGKAADSAHLALDDDGQHVPNARKALQELHRGGEGDQVMDSFLKGVNL